MDKETSDQLLDLRMELVAMEFALRAAMRLLFAEVPDAAAELEARYIPAMDAIKGDPKQVAAMRGKVEQIIKQWLE